MKQMETKVFFKKIFVDKEKNNNSKKE